MQGPFKSTEILSLTGIRFFAALIVVFYHYFRVGTTPYQSPLSRILSENVSLLGRSDYMVDLFFVLSGFVLMHVYVSHVAAKTLSYRTFLIKRFARIYPLHIATFLFFLLMKYAFGNSDHIYYNDIFANITLTHSWGFCEELSFNYPSWSISAEWFAYLLFPLTAITVLRQRPICAIVTAVMFFIVCATISESFGTPITDRKADFGILRIISEFPLGISLARYYHADSYNPSMHTIWILILATILAIQFHAHEIVVVLTMAALTYCCASVERTRAIPVLSHPLIVFGGLISYSIYLVHIPVLSIGIKIGDKIGIPVYSLVGDAWRLFLIVLTLALSVLTYRYLEIPARDVLTKALILRSRPKDLKTSHVSTN